MAENALLDATNAFLDANPDLEAGHRVFSDARHLAKRFASSMPAPDLGAALQVMHLLTRFLVGRGNPGDGERVQRMRDAIYASTESRRGHIVQFIQTAMAPVGWPRPTELVRALGIVEPAFSQLDPAATVALVQFPGRKGPFAIAATLSLQCGAFGDIGDVKAIAAKYDQAWRALTKVQAEN